MNGLDVCILVVLAVGVLTGLRQGFIVEAALILGAVIALAMAKAGYPIVRDVLATVAAKSTWLTAISYLAVFLFVWGLVVALARIGRRGVRLLLLGWADRLGGAVLGFLQAAIVVEMLLFLAKRVHSPQLHKLIHHSQLAPTFVSLIPYIRRLFPHVAG